MGVSHLNYNELTEEEEIFCGEYVKTKKLKSSYKFAFKTGHLSDAGIADRADELYKQPRIRDRMDELRRVIKRQVEFAAADVLRQWVSVALADPAELIRMRRICCRNCHGADFEYQWAEHEFQKAMEHAEKLKNPYPDCRGGFGFKATLPPHPSCPYCYGEGTEDVFVNDLNNVSASARLLYDGIKKTNNGLEVKIRSRDAALDNIAKTLNMFGDKKDDGNSKNNLVGLGELKNITTDPREAAAMYQQIITGK